MEKLAAGDGWAVFQDEDGKLVVELDSKRPGKPSSSGKSKVVATTSGFVSLGGGLSLGLNLIRKA